MVVDCDNSCGMRKAEKRFVRLRNDVMEVTFCTLGASIFRIKYFDDDMLLTPKERKDYFHTFFYHGKTIGRLCGRILKDGEVILHGGQDGISTKDFDYEKQGNKLVFEYTSPDGESGCNGDFFLRVTYELVNTSLTVRYYATVNKTCLVALTNHAYFCLGEDRVEKLILKMGAERYLSLDERMIPVKMLDVPQKWNFETGQSFSETGNIDNFFSVRGGLIKLTSSKYELTIKSDFSGTVIYTDNFENSIPTTYSKALTHRAVAIEPQDNQLFRKELKMGEVYERYITYTFKKL